MIILWFCNFCKNAPRLLPSFFLFSLFFFAFPSPRSSLKSKIDSLTVLQVAVPIENVQEQKGQREHDPGDLVNLGHGVQRHLRIVHGPGDAAFTPALLEVRVALVQLLLIPGGRCGRGCCAQTPISSRSVFGTVPFAAAVQEVD